MERLKKWAGYLLFFVAWGQWNDLVDKPLCVPTLRFLCQVIFNLLDEGDGREAQA